MYCVLCFGAHIFAEETGVTVDFFATKPLMSAFVDLLPTDTLLRVFDVVFVVRSQGLLACMLAILNVGRKDFLSTTSAMEFSEIFYKTCKQQFDADFFVLKVVEMLNKSYELVRRWRALCVSSFPCTVSHPMLTPNCRRQR